MEALIVALVVAVMAAIVGYVLYFGSKSDLKEMRLNMDVANLERRAAQEATRKVTSDLKAMEDAARYASERELAAKAAEQLATAREAEAKAAREAAEAKAKLPVDNPDDRALTKDLVMEAIRANGFDPIPYDESISFKHGEIIIDVWIRNLPIVSIVCVIQLDSAAWNLGNVKKAARQVTDDIMIGKVQYYDLDEERRMLVFRVSSLELSYGRFRESLMHYIKLIGYNYDCFMKEYNQLADIANQINIDDLTQLAGSVNKWEA